jgi:hypothetical protein
MAVLRVLRQMKLIWRMSLEVLGGCFVVVQQMVTDACICIPAAQACQTSTPLERVGGAVTAGECFR